MLKSEPRIYLDKTHPNIWIADKLQQVFPEAQFVGIERDPYATVVSMMQHKSVSTWHHRWREFTIPNCFLGITEELAKTYDDIPFPSKCDLRWVAHHERMNQLKSTLGAKLLVISYESFAHQTEEIIYQMEHFLRLKHPIPIPNVKTDSLQKWKPQFADEEIAQIRQVVGFDPDTDNY